MLKAQVMDTMDISQEGKMKVFCEAIGDDLFDVIYVSPFYTNPQSGFIAIPEKGAEILITQVENSDEWYYLGSVVSRKRGIPDPEDPDIQTDLCRDVMPPEGIYDSRGIPQKLIWKSPMGHTITMSDQYNKDFNNVKLELRSGSGKKILMHDSADVGMILIENEDKLGDGIKIVSDKSKNYPTRSILTTSHGYQVFTCKESEIKMIVMDGQDMHFTNNSTGMNSLEEHRDKSGNINFTSKHKDINITCLKDTGRVFVKCGEHLQLECVDGEVIIHAAKKISIASEDSIHMKAKGDIRLESGGNIDIKAEANLSCEAITGKSNLISEKGVCSIEGSVIYLKDGPYTKAVDANPSPIKKNHYGN